VHQSTTADLADFRDVHPILSSFALTSNFKATTASAAVAELILVFCPPGEPAPRRYRLGIAVLKALLDGISPDGVLGYAQLWLLKLGGFLPPFDICSTCGTELVDGVVIPSLGEGFQCLSCHPSGRHLGPGDLTELRRWTLVPPSSITGDPLPDLRRWLDQMTQDAAEKHLGALAFHRQYGNT
jgi:recombinational DNA repair protein (RecF pathway)